jgi:hypothetical protein
LACVLFFFVDFLFVVVSVEQSSQSSTLKDKKIAFGCISILPVLVNEPQKDFRMFYTGVEIILDGGVQRGTDIAKVFYSIPLHLRFSQITLIDWRPFAFYVFRRHGVHGLQ